MSVALSFAVIVIGAWGLSRVARAVGLPAILGMLVFGVLYGALSALSALPPIADEIGSISGFLTTTALIVILLRAGLGIRMRGLRAIGGSAIRMAFIPCILETAFATAAFIVLFGFDPLTAVIGAAILAAVSPAVVVPSMLDLKERGIGTEKDVPTLVLAGASIDDVVAITIFTSALALFAAGAAAGAGVNGGDVTIGGLGSALLRLPAEIVLFVLIGLAVDLPTAARAGLPGLGVIGVGLVGRSIGVLASVLPDKRLNANERLFALIAYTPKATVQAALGAIPLAAGHPAGAEILSVSVLAIVVTAPIGLLLIRALGPRLLGGDTARVSG